MSKSCESDSLKGSGNEADFLGFLQKLIPHRSLTLPFEPSRFWFRIRGDIRNRKTAPRPGESRSRYGESGSRFGESGSRYSNFLKFIITLNGKPSPLKDQFGKREARDVMYYHH
jgi:hypothetical protein